MSMRLACWWQSFSRVTSSFITVRFVSGVMTQLLLVALSCIFAIVGAVVGCITGAALGQTTETGFFRGCGIGTISGSLVALDLIESILDHNFLSKVGLPGGPADGEIFTDWLTQVLLKTYDFQVLNMQDLASFSTMSDIFDTETGTNGLSPEHISKLPTLTFHPKLDQCDEDDTVSCPICLEDLQEGESGRRLSGCGHYFHLRCIDVWLVRRGSCPVCRQEIAA